MKKGSDAVIKLLENAIAEIKAMSEDERPNRCIVVAIVDKADSMQCSVATYPVGRVDAIRDLEMAKLQIYTSIIETTARAGDSVKWYAS